MNEEKGYGLFHKKRVLIIESQNLLCAAVSRLLSEQSDMDVSHTAINSLFHLDQQSNSFPDVIILDESQLKANLASFMNLSEQFPRMRIIVLGLGGNDLQVFDKQIVQVSQINDFFNLL